MAELEPREVFVTGERVVFPVGCAAPVTRGSVDVCLSTARSGPPVHATLHRALVVVDGAIPELSLFTRDVLAMFPRGGRVWLVVRYGATVIATGEVRLVRAA